VKPRLSATAATWLISSSESCRPLRDLQVFVDHLASADLEIPHRLRHGLEKLRLVDRDRLFLRPLRLRHYRNFVPGRQFIAGPSLGLTGTIPGVVSFL